MDIAVQVCDLEQIVGQQTGRYTITLPSGEKLVTDLCVEHAEPLAVLVEKIKAARASAPSVNVSRRRVAKKATSGQRGRRQVTTLEDIEKTKH